MNHTRRVRLSCIYLSDGAKERRCISWVVLPKYMLVNPQYCRYVITTNLPPKVYLHPELHETIREHQKALEIRMLLLRV